MAVLGFFLLAHTAFAAGTVYVSEQGDDDNNGSKNEPYKTLKKAADEVNEGEVSRVEVLQGNYAGATFSKGVTLVGDSKKGTVITSPVLLYGKSTVKNLAFRISAGSAITIGKTAEVTIENTDIRDAGKAGIWVEPGRARVTLRDSRISGGTKAVYLQAGARLDATGNTIINNSEEGIDIRQNTRGTIKNNTIENNRESGIEVIIGSSSFVITGNSIKNNGASGIASQFYPLNKKLGKIVVTNNTIKGNKNYDLDCKLPQGGNFPPGYWSDSISLEGNTLSAPDGSSLNKRCKILQTGTKEELEALAQSEAEQKEETEEQPIEVETENQPGEVVLPNQDEVTQREQFIQEMQESPSQQLPSLDEKLKQRSSFGVFFIGYDQTLAKEYQQTLEQQKTWLTDKKTAIASQETLASDEQIQGLLRQQEVDTKLQEERALVYTQERGIWNNKVLRSLFTRILRVSVG